MRLDFSKVGNGQVADRLPEARGPEIVVIEQQDPGLVVGSVQFSPDYRPGRTMFVNKNLVDLDLEAAMLAVQRFEPRIAEVKKLAESMVVKDDESAKDAVELSAQVLTLHDEIEALRKGKIEVPDKYVRSVNALCKGIKDVCLSIAGKGGILKRKLGQFEQMERMRLQAIAKRQHEEQAKLQAEIDAEAKAKGVETVTLAPVAVPQKTGPVRSASGSASTKFVTVPCIKDLKAIPREYIEGVFRRNFHTGDEPQMDTMSESVWSRLKSLLMEAHTAGLRDIPGVEFVEKADVSIRR